MKGRILIVLVFGLFFLSAFAFAEESNLSLEATASQDAKCIPAIGPVGTLWVFDCFANQYRVFNSATCDVRANRACVNELGWQGSEIKFKFRLNGDENLSDILRFGINVSRLSTKTMTVYAGHDGLEKIGEKRIDHSGIYYFEIPSRLFSRGTNYIKVKANDVHVGYGQPSQGFVINAVSLSNLRDYVKPALQCPTSAIGRDSKLSWQANDFASGKFKLQLGYDRGFAKKTFVEISDNQSPTSVKEKFNELKKFAARNPSGKLYARLKATHDLKGTAYSNVCEFRLAG